MKTKALLIPFVAVLAVLIVGLASASLTGSLTTTFNDFKLFHGTTTMAGFTGEVVPIRVSFEALKNASDVKVKVRMEGYRDDVTASTSRFNLVNGSTYTKLLSLRLPADINEQTKEFTLYVEVVSADDINRTDYTIKLQREAYGFNVLSVDFSGTVSAGDVFPVSVVVENAGFERLDNGYVVVSIPSLGASSKGYFGDLVPTENCDDNCDDEEDAMQKTVYLKMPENTEAGVYEMEVTVYNRDSVITVNKLVRVGASDLTTVLATVKNQDMRAGETKTYDIVIVNSAKSVKVFNIQTISGTALTVSAPSVVTVGPDSSITVPVIVTASSKADVGTYTFSVDIDGKQVVLGANVTSGGVSTVVALTVILAIIFVVLLVVLIVLLTRKEQPVEEVETSYY